MMRREVVILFVCGGALFAAATAGVIALRIAQRPAVQASQVTSEQDKKSFVLVASDNIPAGGAFSEKYFQWQEWPEAAVKKVDLGDLLQAQEVSAEAGVVSTWDNSVFRTPISRGTPLSAGMLVHTKKGEGSVLSAVISPGMRSITIPVDAIASASGQIQPEDHVDIMVTTDLPDDNAGHVNEPSGSQKPHYATETILSNIRVVTVDRHMEPNVAANAPMPTNFTLEVAPEQAEKIITAERMGRISLALRPLSLGEDIPRKGLDVTTDVAVTPGLQAARRGIATRDLNPKANPWMEVENDREVAESASKKPEAQTHQSITVYHYTTATEIPVMTNGQALPMSLPDNQNSGQSGQSPAQQMGQSSTISQNTGNTEAQGGRRLHPQNLRRGNVWANQSTKPHGVWR